jgi:transposase InsO family protein
MYRILESAGEARERRDQLVHPAYTKPELLATGPNQLWSWDITKLLGPAKWTYFYLYVILDVFSRYVVGWMVADGESSELAKRLIADTCGKQEIEPGKLTIHADRGSSMTSKPVAFLMADLGITKTHSRPHVSDDNPYSESHFRTLKYRPGFPERFGSLQDARSFSRSSSPGITTSTAIPDQAFSFLLSCIMAWRRKPSSSGVSFWMPLTALIPSASSAGRPNRCPRRRRSGSTSPNQLQRMKLSKLCFEVSQTR